ncbi:MAG: ThuA domain-containing protein [Planctomycetales bacterium]
MNRATCSSIILTGAVLGWLADSAFAQHVWQKPSPRMQRAEVEKLIGPIGAAAAPSRSRHIVWVWGYDGNHRPGNHDYTRIRDLMTGLLRQVPQVTVETAYLFPTKQQFDKADLVVMYLHLPGLDESHYALLDPYLKRGGGLVAIHETMIQRPRNRGRQWAERIGLAWSEGESQWGALFTKVFVDAKHPIFKNFPPRVQLVDEFYWRLAETKNASSRKTLGDVPVGPPSQSKGPVPENKLSRERFPVFWTMDSDQGRVFCTLPGHTTFLFHDPKFRVILFRGLAWAMNEKPDPFMPLVFSGIEQNGLVGGVDDLRDWREKPRNPKGEGFAADATRETINAAINARLLKKAKASQ